MYSTIENVLKNGDYNLNDILRKIEILWAKNKLTDEQKDYLISLARGGAKPENDIDILEKLNDLENRVRLLERGENTPEEDTVEYLEFQEGKWYYKGDKCSFEGANYVCIAPDGVVCVWSPTAYPTYWKLQVKEE
jgi:hypothetical protein